MSEPNMKPDDEDMQLNAAADEATQPAEDKAEAKVDESKAEIARLKDQVLRALAEAENTRRRAQKEREDTSRYAVANFAKEMLSVSDNFQRALEAVPKEARDNEAVKNLITGIEAIDRQLQQSLEHSGIKKIEPMGQPFDPNFHRVMMEIEDGSHPAGTVVKVLQPGYVIHDRLLREALVAVSKSGPPAPHKVDTSA
jgi:molecular chaperone GrpE